ncbi:MAG TPA: inorganic diphosphatase [Candidatus Limnocylindrales bacterium]|nr:inorganic diphosphatase [Candidatus Limnocylindrales bacterium]
MDQSTRIARSFLGQEVQVTVDRPLGSKHPEAGFNYELNYGYVPGTLAPDGEELDAYLMGVDGPVAEAAGHCVAIVHRLYEDDDKLVVVVTGSSPTDAQIREAVRFQEGGRPYEILRD